jgi:DNA-binding CsgD family transcriptional regulator
MAATVSTHSGRSDRTVLLSIAGLVVQSAAAAYFIIDGVDDVLGQLRSGISGEVAMECLVALALVLAIIISARQLRMALAAAKRQQAALAVARGSIADLLDAKFSQWGLSPSEREVTLFALKGCSIAEIAKLRGSAEGTVRSQLSQVYAKAEVTSQSMLIGQFIEELI